MKTSFRNIIKKIPLVRRIYNSVFVRLFKLLNKKYFLINFMDVKFNLDIQEPIDKSIILFDYYENEQLRLTIELITKYKVNIFFDIGAHCGIYTLIMANKFDNLIIHSFEPINFSFKRLKNNILLNKRNKNINTYSYGLSSSNRTLRMKGYNKDNYIQLGGFGVINKKDKLKNNFITEAEFKKGDDYFNFKNQIIFLKIDVEGHELDVLNGLEKLLNSNKIIIQIEIFADKYAFVKKKLKALNFKEINKIKLDYYFIN